VTERPGERERGSGRIEGTRKNRGEKKRERDKGGHIGAKRKRGVEELESWQP
jgi:hypothetical protein